MHQKRQVDLKILFGLLRSRGPLPTIGLIFTLIFMFIIFPLIACFSLAFTQPYEKYDIDAIKKYGTLRTAFVTSVDFLRNVNVNGQNPEVIDYEYQNNNRKVADRFETIDFKKVSSLKAGDQIKVFSFNNQSIISGIEPFAFPVKVFFLIPLIFLVIGAVLLSIGLIPALKIFNLYKYGILQDASVVSIDSYSPALLVASTLSRAFTVHYYFSDVKGQKTYGETKSTDILFLNETRTGDMIKIFVSEKNEKTSCLVPRLEAAKYNWLTDADKYTSVKF